MTNGGDVAAQFRERTAYMKTWKPDSNPSNRDRLELYALHKQAVSGDAPDHLPCATAVDRSKFQAWKNKRGTTSQQAMHLYLQEADRQVRVYGSSDGALAADGPNAPVSADAASQQQQQDQQQPRGLAAIPLLCAAAGESRQAYLSRLAHTSSSWWRRQEALCAAPSTFGALPETALLQLASATEHVALHWSIAGILPAPVVQSFLWPLHNVLLCLWMGLIVVLTGWGAAWDLFSTTVWGTRRTGHTLQGIWKDAIHWSAHSVSLLTETHQPVGARLMGLVLSPYSLLVQLIRLVPAGPDHLILSVAYIGLLAATWWYWMIVLPFLCLGLGWAALVSGACFGLIEMAGV